MRDDVATRYNGVKKRSIREPKCCDKIMYAMCTVVAWVRMFTTVDLEVV